MTRHFIRLLFDLHCEWEGSMPDYRIYVNDELFTERTYGLTPDMYFEEMLQIEAPPGNYSIRCELVPPTIAHLRVENMRVDFGPGTIENNILRIDHALA